MSREPPEWLPDVCGAYLLDLCWSEFYRRLASAIEAQRAATAQTGAVHESAVAESQTPVPYELKSCPFCGGEQVATAPDNEFGDVTWDAICKACGARVSRDLEEQAIAAWNTRTQSPTPCDPSPNSSQDRV